MTTSARISATSLTMAALAIFAAIVSALDWYRTSAVASLLASIAFLALTPGFSLTPIHFRKSLKENVEASLGGRVPGWVSILTFAGIGLLGLSLVFRWVG